MLGLPKIVWSEHWTNGGTGMTLISPEKLSLFQAAVKKLGDSNVYIINNGLHYAQAPTNVDISHFWDVFYELEGNPRNNA